MQIHFHFLIKSNQLIFFLFYHTLKRSHCIESLQKEDIACGNAWNVRNEKRITHKRITTRRARL